MKIIILGTGFNTFNRGIWALTASAIKVIVGKFPKAEISLLEYGKISETYKVRINSCDIPIDLLNIRFSKRIFLKNNIVLLLCLSWLLKLLPFRNFRTTLIKRNYYFSQILEADLVAALSGGDSFSDIYGFARFLYVSLPQLLVVSLRKDLVLLPQTIGPFKSIIAKKIAGFIMDRSRIIFTRDFEGIQSATKLMSGPVNSEKTRFCYDLAFVLEPIRPVDERFEKFLGEIESKSHLVGFNISGLLYRGGYSEDNMFHLKIDYKLFVEDLIEFLITKKKQTVVLIPHVFGSHFESDLVACNEVYELLKARFGQQVLVASGEFNQSEIKYIIGRCDFLIGSRMHACIAGLSQNIPTVSIAYSRKFFGVMQSIGVEELVADPRQLEQRDIFKVIDDAFENRSFFRKKLEENIPFVKETILTLFDRVPLPPGKR